MRSLWIGAAGLGAGQLQMDVTANNIANVNTVGFASRRVSFRDQVAGPLTRPVLAPTDQLPTTTSGVWTTASLKSTEQGPLLASDSQYHLAIEGPGYFRVRGADGSVQYTRSGAFNRDTRGRLVTADGAVLLRAGGSALVLPEGTSRITVATDGTVTAETAEGDREVGTIELALFSNPGGLEARGGGLFAATLSSGPQRLQRPGTGGSGVLRQGMLEQSNVELGQEMVSMLLANRHTQFSARIVQTSDEMMALANRLPT